MMYVVRRAFRNYGQMMVPGSVVEPGSIKRFKSHLNDRDIIEVSEQTFDKWDKYFRERMGVAIQVPSEDLTDEAANTDTTGNSEEVDEATKADTSDEASKAADTKEEKQIAKPKATVVVKPSAK